VDVAGVRYVEGPRGRLRVSDGGAGGLPAVLVHGGAGDLDPWSAQLEHLRRIRRAVALDLAGMGGSSPPRDGDFTLAAMADDVHAAAEALGLGRFALVGHSHGGAVISAYAAAAFPGPLLAVGAEMLDGPAMAQRALPVRAFRIMKNVSHWLMMDRPDEFDRLLGELLADVR
jgi:pimeloyl-ACP methyl ester carboxylesterase